MQLRSLQKFGGYSIIAGAVLFTIWAICWTFLLPVSNQIKDFSAVVTHPNWIWINSLALPGIILTIFGFTALYSRIYNKSGWLGFLGYIFITTAYIFQAAMLTWEIFLYPAIASHEPSLILFREEILFGHSLVSLFGMIFSATILLGVLLFGIALIRFKEFKKTGGVLFLSGAVIYAIGPAAYLYISILGVVIFAAGCFLLGMNIIRQE